MHRFECSVLAKGRPLIQSVLGTTEKNGRSRPWEHETGEKWKPVAPEEQMRSWDQLSLEEKHALLQVLRIPDIAGLFAGVSDKIQNEMIDILILEYIKFLLDELPEPHKLKVLSKLTRTRLHARTHAHTWETVEAVEGEQHRRV